MDLKEFASGFLLLGLFALAIFTFIFTLEDNNTKIANLDTAGIDITALEARLNSSTGEANDYMESFSKDSPVENFFNIIFFSIIGVGKLVINSIIITFNIILGGISTILGIPPIVTSVISAIVIISLIFAAWKVYNTGK